MPYTNPDAGRPAAPAPFGPLADGCAAPSRQDVAAGRGGRLHWRAGLARFERPRVSRALLDLATSVLPYLALLAAIYFALGISDPLALALALPAAGFLLRTFIVFHDCAHGSFLPSKRLNEWLGRLVGLLVYEPFTAWRHSHAVHHATAGDLDRRGVGDVPTLTVAEYRASPWRRRLGYRLFRNPVVMFGIGPIYALLVEPRLVSRSARARIKRSVIGTNAVLALAVAALCWTFGWRDYLLVQMPPALLAGAAGVWLFYVQHQFEGTYWRDGEDWSYVDAALEGSSYLDLPKLLQFFTGNIGLHNVHHLSARVPNYNLQRAHDEIPIFQRVPRLSLWDGMRAASLKLWDEDLGRLVTFGEAQARPAPTPATSWQTATTSNSPIR